MFIMDKIGIIVFFYANIVLLSFAHCSYRKPVDIHYDFIIVGGGTAGSVVATRLSENVDHTVLVLEAGINDRDYPPIDVPWMLGVLQGTHVDWQFKTEPMKNASKELKNQQASWPIGKVLGGSSTHNFLEYVRGSPHDYDWWESLGNEGWSYKDVLPYFKKSENNKDPIHSKTDYHSIGGPWTIETSAINELGELIVQAGEELGYSRLDVNGPDGLGWDKIQHNTRYGRRLNTALAFMWPNRHRPNLFVQTNAHVTKILFDGKTAVGVEYMKNNNVHTVYARKEVILSAGAINSPQLLMLSGIGPAQHLQSHGIDVIADLPVGSYLEDHYMTFLSFTINSTLSITEKTLSDPMTYYKYLFGLGGDFSTSGTQTIAFHRTQNQPKEHKFPYVEALYWIALPGNNKALADGLRDTFNARPEFWDDFYENGRGKDGFAIFLANVHPRSTGTVRLKNKDPFTHPILKMEYLDHPDDVKDMIEGIRIQMKLIKTKTMQSIGTAYIEPLHKGCTQYEFDSDDYWECYIRHRTLTVYHQTCSCKMSPGPDGVLDNKLRVKGIRNLRVVDASVMPHVTSGNTMAPTVMIAEKAADLIKQSH